jgi:hypothetical protein
MIRGLATDDKQLGDLLEKVLKHPSMSGVRAAMPSLMEDSELRAARTALAIQAQQSTALVAARTTSGKKRGRASDDRRSFVNSVLVASSGTPTTDTKIARTAMGAHLKEEEQVPLTPVEMPSLRERARALGLPEGSGHRLLKLAECVRRKLVAGEGEASWSTVQARKGHQKVHEELRAALLKWILNHNRVVDSPIKDEAIWCKNKQTGV